MTLYKIDHPENLTNAKISKVARTTYEALGLRERQDIQNMLKTQIDVIAPGVMIVAEEFGDWDASRRRIDLLGVDESANLVVIELKRTEDAGHSELQAIRYAAMISSMTFEDLVRIYTKFLKDNNQDKNAQDELMEFFGWGDEVKDDEFAQQVKIVLASSDFSKELTTSVMWLNRNDFLDIRCIRMHPYKLDGKIYLDIQTVIPLPESEEYLVKIKQKNKREHESRLNRDTSKYDLVIDEQEFPNLSKRRAVFELVRFLIESKVDPRNIKECFPTRKNNMFLEMEGVLEPEEVIAKVHPREIRYFCDKGEFFHSEEQNKTYILTNQWGKETIDGIKILQEKYPEFGIQINKSI